MTIAAMAMADMKVCAQRDYGDSALNCARIARIAVTVY